MPSIDVGEIPSDYLPEIYKFLKSIYYCMPFIRVTLVITSLGALIQCYYFVKMFNYNVLMQYSTGCLAALYVSMMHVICIVGYQHAIDMHTVLREWSSIHDATIHSRKLKKALFNIKLKAKVSFVIGFVLTTATVVIGSYYFIQDSLLLVILDRDNYLTRDSLLYKVLTKVLYLCTVMIISMSVSAPFYYIYGLVQDKVAVLLVTDYVYEMNEKCKHMKSFSYSVKEDLDVLVVKHLETIHFMNLILESNQVLYFLYICNGVLVALLSMCAYFSPANRVFQAGVSSTCFLFFIYTFDDSSEEYVQLCHELADAVHNLDWYNWNLQCQKAYLTIITYMSRPVNVHILLVDINRELFTKMLKFLYPMLNFLYTTRNQYE